MRLTSHRGGFVGLWSSLVERRHFPARFLTHSKQMLREFIETAQVQNLAAVCEGNPITMPGNLLCGLHRGRQALQKESSSSQSEDSREDA
jgi:hypothetical protein